MSEPERGLQYSESPEQARVNALAWLEGTARARDAETLVRPYIHAAAVLSVFQLATLRPVGTPSEKERSAALIELTNACRPVGDLTRDTWQLEENARRRALRQLGHRAAMRAARNVNAGPPEDSLQMAIDLLIDQPVLKLDALSLDVLLGLERALPWFRDLQINIPSAPELTARIERERLLAPMRRLAGKDFVDREKYLAQLNEYVCALPPRSALDFVKRRIPYVHLLKERPPLHLHGPGGIGKSALLAKFILDHADPSLPMAVPVVYLDFDRSILDPRDPQTLLDEAIRQLLVQFPDIDPSFAHLGQESLESLARSDAVEQSKSAGFRSHKDLIRRFCQLLDVIADRNRQPVLLVLDTLEEAEYQGQSAMLVIWNLLEDLLRRVDRLRVVTAGRSALASGLARQPLEVTELPEAAAIQMLMRKTARIPGGPVSESDARVIVNIVRTVPLNLALAARVVINEGIDALRDTVSRRSLFSRIKAEQQQGMLYRRVLGHVRAHDPVLEKIANPGLVLRRITPDIIEHVLSGPCQLDVRDSDHALQLFNDLAREVGLVDPYREAGALWHLPAVRRVMLPDLRGTLGGLAHEIDVAAASYYSDKLSVIGQGELIYHLLWLKADLKRLDSLWKPEFAANLRSAFDELEPQAKIWLGDKLGVELDPALRAQADDTTWERQAAQRAETLMASGLAEQALQAIQERPHSGRPSPIYGLESDALKLLGRLEEAREILAEGLAKAETAGEWAMSLSLTLRTIFIDEALENLNRAILSAQNAMSLAATLHSYLDWLSAGVAALRIVRKLRNRGHLPETEEQARAAGAVVFQRGVDAFVDKTRTRTLTLLQSSEIRLALRDRPALLQECAAEIGEHNVDLLQEAVSVLGVRPEDLLALLQESVDAVARKLQEESGAAGPRLTTRGIGNLASEWVTDYPSFFMHRLRLVVEDNLRRTVRRVEQSAYHPRLTGSDISALVHVVTRYFSREDLDLLAHDALDIPLANVVSDGTLAEQAFGLLHYAQQVGRLNELVTRMARSRPNAPELSSFVESRGINSAI
jgi:hypothetical protein